MATAIAGIAALQSRGKLQIATSPSKKTSQKSKKKSEYIDPSKKKEEFRNYTDSKRQARVSAFYRVQHERITMDFVLSKRKEHLAFDKCRMDVWAMLAYLDKVVDESDPDTDLTQIGHAIQTAESARRMYPDEDKYDWFHCVALIHDLGKILSVTDEKMNLKGDPQWCVVGDNFPVGCRFDSANVFPEYFEKNPDMKDPRFNSRMGIYKKGVGLMSDQVIMGWGHDEYLYAICRHQSSLPIEALYCVRFHSFYAWHKGGAYMDLCDERDLQVGLPWVRKFNKCDLYSKSTECPDLDEVAPYYQKIIKKYFPNPVQW